MYFRNGYVWEKNDDGLYTSRPVTAEDVARRKAVTETLNRRVAEREAARVKNFGENL